MRDNTLKDSLIVKFGGRAEIPTELEIGYNYLISATGTITGKTEKDNNDGTHTVYYHFEPIHIDLITDKGERIKLSDPRRNSQKIRNFLFKEYANEGFTEDFDSVYDAFTVEVMLLTPQLLRAAIKRLNK